MSGVGVEHGPTPARLPKPTRRVLLQGYGAATQVVKDYLRRTIAEEARVWPAPGHPSAQRLTIADSDPAWDPGARQVLREAARDSAWVKVAWNRTSTVSYHLSWVTARFSAKRTHCFTEWADALGNVIVLTQRSSRPLLLRGGQGALASKACWWYSLETLGAALAWATPSVHACCVA